MLREILMIKLPLKLQPWLPASHAYKPILLSIITALSSPMSLADETNHVALPSELVTINTINLDTDQHILPVKVLISDDQSLQNESIELPAIQVTGERFKQSRSSVSSKTGGSAYQFDSNDIKNLPSGENTPLNEVLLQAPGVVNDSYGQLHVRGDHANTQYRINDIVLPEGLSGFGQALDTRFAHNINLLTGALPAEYGFRTSGVVEITTKGNYNEGGNIDLYGGSNNTYNPSIQFGGTDGNFSYYVNGSYLTNNLGIENPTSSINPIHDNTKQEKGFVFLNYFIDNSTSLSFIGGTYSGKFQIPNNPGQTPNTDNLTTLDLPRGYNSSTLNDQQSETSRFGVLALQGSLTEKLDYQLALFTRYSSFQYVPDVVGNLVFNSEASDIFRSSFSTGLQVDSSYHLNDANIVKFGLLGSVENIQSNNTSSVFPISSGSISSPVVNIVDNNPKNGNTLMGIYLQDAWKVNNKLTVNYGARFDAVDAFISEHQLSPRVGLVYKVTDQTTFHTGYARYFTPPPTELVSSSTLALFQGTTGQTTSLLNSPVKSERGDYLDTGLSHQLTPALSLGIDTYYKKTKNTVDEGQFGPALLLTPFNYGEGRIYGVELTANYKLDNFSTYANFARNISQAKDIVSGQYLFNQATLNYAANNWINVDHAQSLTISSGGSYVLPDGIRLKGDLIFASGLRNGFANTTSLPSYTVFNLGASQKLKMPSFGDAEVRLVINNLFDRIYEIRDGTGIGVFAPQYGPRRGLFIGLSKSF